MIACAALLLNSGAYCVAETTPENATPRTVQDKANPEQAALIQEWGPPSQGLQIGIACQKLASYQKIVVFAVRNVSQSPISFGVNNLHDAEPYQISMKSANGQAVKHSMMSPSLDYDSVTMPLDGVDVLQPSQYIASRRDITLEYLYPASGIVVMQASREIRSRNHDSGPPLAELTSNTCMMP